MIRDARPVAVAQAQAPGEAPVTWVCYGLIATCAAIYLADLAVTDGQLRQTLLLYGPLVQEGQWWRPLTCIFVHAQTPLHIVFNMMAVLSIGRNVERGIGSARFLIVSGIGALGSALLVLLVNFDQPTLGASGMILSWGGAILPILNQSGRRQIGIWIAQVAVISLLPGISWAGHLGGFLVGLPCGLTLRQSSRWFAISTAMLFAALVMLLYLASSGRFSWGHGR